MRRERVRDLLTRVADGSVAPELALNDLTKEPLEGLDFATIDHHRALRQGFPEVIYGAGKTSHQIVAIAEHIAEHHGGFLATRLSEEASAALARRFEKVEINALGRTAHLSATEPPAVGKGTVLIVTAGTSDLPVAEEAAVTACALGNSVGRLNDVGVAGLHRVLAKKEEILGASVVIVIAGMDGALASVIGGLVRAPVIAVPTSVGYGAAFGGIAPLLAMLNSCAAGVTVVNIDNGFGAAMAASRINHS
jgi:NCAIR mutase (PurE)-related protein